MNHDELAARIEAVKEKVDSIEQKMDAFVDQCTKNATDLAWLKSGGSVGVTILLAVLGFLAVAYFQGLSGGQ